jgi:ribosomal protein L3 glutamine methyltransferase
MKTRVLKTGSDTHSVEALIRQGATQFETAGLSLGHGTDTYIDEAAELVFFAAGFAHEDAARVYPQVLEAPLVEAIHALFARRIRERLPAAYLTNRMWFSGLEFYVDERVLVPRSPIAELIETQFAPWIDPDSVDSILDLCTGSGCIAIACAYTFDQARVWASDISDEALAVARINVQRHELDRRVELVRSDVWSALGERRFDIVVSNPPYVSEAEMAQLPTEYQREPSLGLRAGDDGLSIVRRILAQADTHLTPSGILVIEVGDTEQATVDAYPEVPFTWLEFERGGGGVFLLTAAEVREYRHVLRAAND